MSEIGIKIEIPIRFLLFYFTILCAHLNVLHLMVLGNIIIVTLFRKKVYPPIMLFLSAKCILWQFMSITEIKNITPLLLINQHKDNNKLIKL